eukprot:11168525-Lingulodinium_polyedra.AAC.1
MFKATNIILINSSSWLPTSFLSSHSYQPHSNQCKAAWPRLVALGVQACSLTATWGAPWPRKKPNSKANKASHYTAFSVA